jgi:hypothetical protein
VIVDYKTDVSISYSVADQATCFKLTVRFVNGIVMFRRWKVPDWNQQDLTHAKLDEIFNEYQLKTGNYHAN